MKKSVLSLLLALLLCFGLAGCGTTGQSEKDASISDAASTEDDSTSQEFDSSNKGDTSPDVSDSGTEHGYTIQNGLLVTGNSNGNMETAGQSATENNTTLSDVVLSDIYESQADMMAVMGDDEHAFADEVCYDLGMALWDYGDGTEGGYIPFWAFFFPPDGTITFSTEENDYFEENPYFQIDGFTMKEEENSEEQWPLKSEELKYWNASFTGRYVSEELSAGEHTISLDEIREAIPEFDVLACWWGDTYILAVCVQ